MQSVTVSYGSFSLTVDGYDDPFKVIHEITGLYAKMATQYPGFGAEPMKTQIENPEAAQDFEENLFNSEVYSEKEESQVDILEPALSEVKTEPTIQPLRLNTPIPRYRRIDMSQIRAAADPLTTDDFGHVEPNIRRFPVNGEK